VEVEVIRSPRRRRTVQARQVGDVLRVSIPSSMTKAEEERWVAEMVGRMGRKAAAESVDLQRRAQTLAARYRLPPARSVRWVDNQQWRWGSCTPADGSVRISNRLAGLPGWVLDYVIVHELAHLDVPRHNRDFWAIVSRYPRTERARGYLMAKGMDDVDAAGEVDPPAPTQSPRRRRRSDPGPAQPELPLDDVNGL
jgi:predicted metal-dependent hydrolase